MNRKILFDYQNDNQIYNPVTHRYVTVDVKLTVMMADSPEVFNITNTSQWIPCPNCLMIANDIIDINGTHKCVNERCETQREVLYKSVPLSIKEIFENTQYKIGQSKVL